MPGVPSKIKQNDPIRFRGLKLEIHPVAIRVDRPARGAHWKQSTRMYMTYTVSSRDTDKSTDKRTLAKGCSPEDSVWKICNKDSRHALGKTGEWIYLPKGDNGQYADYVTSFHLADILADGDIRGKLSIAPFVWHAYASTRKQRPAWDSYWSSLQGTLDFKPRTTRMQIQNIFASNFKIGNTMDANTSKAVSEFLHKKHEFEKSWDQVSRSKIQEVKKTIEDTVVIPLGSVTRSLPDMGSTNGVLSTVTNMAKIYQARTQSKYSCDRLMKNVLGSPKTINLHYVLCDGVFKLQFETGGDVALGAAVFLSDRDESALLQSDSARTSSQVSDDAGPDEQLSTSGDSDTLSPNRGDESTAQMSNEGNEDRAEVLSRNVSALIDQFQRDPSNLAGREQGKYAYVLLDCGGQQCPKSHDLGNARVLLGLRVVPIDKHQHKQDVEKFHQRR